jgi:hypothetical protein
MGAYIATIYVNISRILSMDFPLLFMKQYLIDGTCDPGPQVQVLTGSKFGNLDPDLCLDLCQTHRFTLTHAVHYLQMWDHLCAMVGRRNRGWILSWQNGGVQFCNNCTHQSLSGKTNSLRQRRAWKAVKSWAMNRRSSWEGEG